jgi:pantothenate kinase
MELESIANKIKQVPLIASRRTIAIVGPPASGKSTLAESLEQQIAHARVLPMDGFHRDNADLEAHGLLARKGAPETFDVAGFERIVRAIRDETTISFPTFDRRLDRAVPNGGHIRASDETIIIEGNYLLLDVLPWARMRGLWDFSIMLDVTPQELERRLVERWLTHGHSQKEAIARVQGNDLPNALYMREHSTQADLVLSQS